MDGTDDKRLVKLSDLLTSKQIFEEVSSDDVTKGITLTACTQHWKVHPKTCPIIITLYGARSKSQKPVAFRFLLQRAESSDKKDTLILVPPSPSTHSQSDYATRNIRDNDTQSGLFLLWTIRGEMRARGLSFGHVSVNDSDIVIKKLNEPDLDDFTGDEVCYDLDFYSGAIAFTSSKCPGFITVLRFD